MATPTTETHVSNKNNGNKPHAADVNVAPAGWKKIETDRPLYNSNHGKGGVIKGHMLGIIDMPPANGKDWQALIVRLTAPCGTCKNRDDAEVKAEEGQEILVPLTHQMRQHLARAAVHPDVVFEVWIKPTNTVKTAAGSMIVYDMQVNPQAQKRSPADRMLAMQAQAPALPPAGGSGQGRDSADDIPFG